ncbi:MAG: hypothetical protein JRN52_06375, partial [Nitrososphaerota archaeon]|nr:hypothetical protein [Nitrososphaerota archaeon]
SNLDAKVREKTRIELKNLLSKIGIASVYVTHDQEEAFLLSDKIVVMNQGSIIQVDTPYNIYHYPANEFVASFVGKSNMIDGMVVSKKARGRGTVRILGQYDIDCEVPDLLPEGSACSVIIRANEVGMLDEKPKTGNIIPCEVESREYKGAVTDHIVKVGNVSLTVTTHRFCELNHVHPDESMRGRKAFLDIRGEAVTIVPKDVTQ